ncbi:MAG TPA: FAD-binding and (Fe-S)-binding domain-containing protein [Solirubrobacterales bacterium]|nr:FAD-binding and (Fe-S)-binding domain-containing protein [Solirubrobacterales bacterium]
MSVIGGQKNHGTTSVLPPPSQPVADRAPDELAGGVDSSLRRDLEQLLGADRVLHRVTDLVSYASDASPYRRFPRAVVEARDAEDIAKVLRFGREREIPVTFRAGGTSLNGQGQSDGILVDVRKHWGGVRVEDDGVRARVKPGTILGHANRVLAPHGRKLGPDPASTDVCTVGGVVANNSGGMRCGVTKDSYSTVRELTFVLPSGTVIDTGAPGAAERFAAAEPELVAGLEAIRDDIRADAELAERIRRKFEIKNTTGYRLCAFLDADEPLEIFRRLLVGSEGTLAFIAEVVFETVPVSPVTTTAWVHFPGIDEAVAPVGDLVASGATAVELMVAPALITAAWNMVGAPQEWKELPPESAVLLVEFGGADEGDLAAQVLRAEAILGSHETIRPIDFTRAPETIELAWRVREGLHGLIGRVRPEGTALIVEDVCVPPARIAEGAKDLQALLGEHGFLPGVAGHASAGNLHFMLTPDFAKQEDLERYEAFMGGLVELIVGKYDGSLKAEHGTGVNMAPYVEREWGEKATELMWRLKRLADPDGVLSPGVILSRDPGVHLRDLKTTPAIEDWGGATTCVECGFCEPVCPSRNLTTTPRQRIVLRREMARQPEGSPVQRALLEEYDYDALQTCATDGSCQIACPLGIDTGRMVKELRVGQHGERAERAALAAAKRWGAVERLSRWALKVGGPLARRTKRGKGLPGAARWGGAGDPPRAHLANGSMLSARGGSPAPPDGAAAVYVPSCTNRIFGPSKNEMSVEHPYGAEVTSRSVVDDLVTVSARAGMPVAIPEDVPGSCCGLPWSSKGFAAAHAHKANEMVGRLWEWSGEGALPVVIDAASCTGAIADPAEGVLSEENSERLGKLEIVDSVAWALRLLPNLEIDTKVASATVHPTCATRRLALAHPLRILTNALADDVYIAPSATCCAFAGDRGITHPELTASATRPQAEELSGRSFDAYLSSNRTCEIAMTRATGQPYESVLSLLERLSRRRS